MNHSTKLMSLLGAGAIVLAGMAGCSKGDADNAASTVSTGADSAAAQVKAAGNSATGVADNAVKAVDNTVTAAVDKTHTPQIKTDIAANPVGKTITDLNVDTKDKTITLMGTGSAAAKKAAGTIAAKDAPGFTITNDIKVK